ncbi:MAG: SGNH/GDSL hydrolase family protein [Lachnospiraceae bacterium]|nr:SGNH/GDSL hydrolase family protein [Lachnospiraceae bacterium]
MLYLNGKSVSIGGGSSFFTESNDAVNILALPTVGAVSSAGDEGWTTTTSEKDWKLTEYVKINPPNITFKVKTGTIFGMNRIAFYDDEKNFIVAGGYSALNSFTVSDASGAKVIRCVNVPKNASWLRVQYRVTMTELSMVNFVAKSSEDFYPFVFEDGFSKRMRNMFGVENLDNPFAGRSMLAIGDSITENNAKNDNKSWAEYMYDVFGMNVINDGKSGTGLIKGYGGYKSICNRVDGVWVGTVNYDEIQPDVILIMGNGNDSSGGAYYGYDGASVSMSYLPVGNPTDGADALTVYGAVRHVIGKLIERYPLAKIGWILSTPRDQTVGSGVSFTERFSEYAEAIKAVCNEYSVPVLDLFHNSALRPDVSGNASVYFADSKASDGLVVHPNTKGVRECMVRPIARWMLDNF